MQQYFNRNDREHHIIMMVFYQVIKKWLERNKSLLTEERRYINTGLTWLKKGYDSMIVRATEEYIRTLKNTAKHSDLFLEDNTGRSFDSRIDTRTLDVEDLYDLADLAVRECAKCNEKDFKTCKRHQLFMKLAIPPVTEQTDDCPYR